MKIRLVLTAMAVLLAMGNLTAWAQQTIPFASTPDGSVALAEECSIFAHQLLRGRKLTPAALRMSAALYRAAAKLDPTEPRFARSLVDVLLKLGDTEAATKALTDYRMLVPDDQTAQVQQIDLYLQSPMMQSNDQRLTYMKQLLYKKALPAEVRSEVAVRCYRLLANRADYPGALKMLDTAINLNPLNITALRTRFYLTQDSASPVNRIDQMAAIFVANPTDPVVASRIAEQLAQLGLVDLSTRMYGLANRIYQATFSRPDPAFFLGAGSELLVGGHGDDATGPIDAYVTMAVDDPDGWYLGLSAARYASAQDPKDRDLAETNRNALRKATIALTNRLQDVRLSIGDKEATTRPLDAPSASVLPVLTDDVKRISDSKDDQVKAQYIGAVSSLAWLDLFYQHDADAAQPLIDVLAKLLPSSDPALGRLTGWQLYVRGDTAGATAKFKPLAKTDPLSDLGLVLIDLASPDAQAKAEVAAQRLLNEHPSGVIGAILWVELSPYKATIEPPPQAKGASEVIANMPQSTVDILSSPQSFYLASLEPLQMSYDFGQPILVRVRIENISSTPLAIGDLAPMKPTIWFDAFLRGMVERSVTGCAIGRIDQRLVLQPGKQVSTIVRMDQDALEPVLNAYNSINLGLNFTMVLNPVQLKPTSPDQLPEARSGLCGYSTQLSNLIERTPTPIETEDERKALLAQLNAEDGDLALRVIKVLALYAAQLRGNAQTQSVSDDFISHIRKVKNPSPSVTAWQKYILEQLDDPDSQVADIKEMASVSDPKRWQSRLLALLAASVLKPGEADDITEQLASDSDPIISEFATGLQEAQKISTTQPAANISAMPTLKSDNSATPQVAPDAAPGGGSSSTPPAGDTPTAPLGGDNTTAPPAGDAPAMPAQQ
jgi:tetratricopeptide (TPR) repeat protein